MPHSLSELRQVRQEIERTLRQRAAEAGRPVLTSIGQGKAVIHVDLRVDQENVAGELAARYGSAVELRVGAFSFPGRRRVSPRPPARPALEERALEGLEMSVEVDQAVLEAGDDGDGRLVLRNNGQDRTGPLDCGQPLVGSLLDASREAVGGYSGAIGGTGLFVDLERDDQPASGSSSEPPASARSWVMPCHPAGTGSRSRCTSGPATASQLTRSPPP
jgi:hypothetical protein